MTAFTTQISTVFCDHDLNPRFNGCNASKQWESTTAEARQWAKLNGWTRQRVKDKGWLDFCPEHSL